MGLYELSMLGLTGAVAQPVSGIAGLVAGWAYLGDEFRTGVTNLFAAADPWANLVAPTI
jgi:hypothetical protein